jgi:hypothetical protein
VAAATLLWSLAGLFVRLIELPAWIRTSATLVKVSDAA